MALGWSLPSVAAAFGLFLGFDVVAVVADGSKVARIARVAAITDGHDLVDSGRCECAAGSAYLTLMVVASQDL